MLCVRALQVPLLQKPAGAIGKSSPKQQSSPKKSRSKMERVAITDERSDIQILNQENSLCALVAWLDKYNSDLASKYGVDKLVWCERKSDSRRWFHVDVDNGMRQKSLRNASAAIECMQKFTKTDFYNDLYTRTSDFPFAEARTAERPKPCAHRTAKIPAYPSPHLQRCGAHVWMCARNAGA